MSRVSTSFAFPHSVQLLEHGATPHVINPAMDNRGGTPLHEATRGKHVAMAEMLLRAGASPFQCNALGKTCLDEAVFVGCGPLLRLYESSAIWRGKVAVRVRSCTNDHTLFP